MQFPKTLLLSATLPGTGHVGEIILGDIVRRAGLDRFHCVAVASAKNRWRPDPALSGLAVRSFTTDALRAKRWGSGKWGAAGSVIHYRTGFQAELSKLARAIVTEAKAAQIGQVFAVLDNAMMFALAHRVAGRLGVPLVSLVWDPPEYLLRQAGFDRWSRAGLLREFQRSLKASRRVAVVSETMADAYARYTDAPIGILRHGLPMPDETAASESCVDLPRDEWLIGFAGTMYSPDAWNALLKALDQADWQVAGRPVRLRVMTSSITLANRKLARIDYLGFRSTEDVQALLSGCHVTYMPQPFVAHLRDLCRYSFPTKLSNYLVLGRPVFLHAPPEGALSAFFRSHPFGASATGLEPEGILQALDALLGNAETYAAACASASRIARQHFSTPVFHAAVDALLADA